MLTVNYMQILTSVMKGRTTALDLVDCAATQPEASRVPVSIATPVTEELALLLTAELWLLSRKEQRAAPKQHVGPQLHLAAILAIN